jgi:hypothetical protein
MFVKNDGVKFKIMNYPNCLSYYRHVADEVYRNSFSFIAIGTLLVHNYNHGQSGQGMVIGAKYVKC